MATHPVTRFLKDVPALAGRARRALETASQHATAAAQVIGAGLEIAARAEEIVRAAREGRIKMNVEVKPERRPV